jgi:hypothetical protein
MNPYVILGAAILLAVSHGFAFVKGRGWERAGWEAKVAEQTAKVIETERIWQGAYNEASKSYLTRIRTTDDRLRIALDGLRDRPDRPMPEAPRADCKGATGAELSRRDAEFLAGVSTRADRIRAGYELCLRSYDTLTHKPPR